MSTLRRSELIFAFTLAFGVAASTAHADEDALAPYRDRFRQGMEKYKVGAMAEAIRAWSAIYEEIGPQRGYRLSFNLARAYEANFETSRAAERYQSFLDEVAARRTAGETIDPLVEKEATEAQARLGELDANNGRIRVVSSGRIVAAQVDASDPRLGTFVTYVAPGNHVVIFAPGSTEAEPHLVTVKAGELVLVSPTPLPEPPPVVLPPPLPPPEPKPHRIELEHPFSPTVLYVSAGVTVASIVAPIVTYAHAVSLIDTYYSPQTQPGAQKNNLNAEYQSAKTTAYDTLAIPLALTAVTGALVAYYFGVNKEREVTVGATVLPGGGAAMLGGSF
jgi:hypothetical protein